MSEVVYAIVFSGEVIEGFQAFSVKAHLSQMLKADAAKMATLFSGKAVVIKRTADKQEALKYGSALKKVGAVIQIKAMKVDAATAAKSKPEAKPVPAEPANELGYPGDWALLPAEGNLVEPRPAPPPPKVDLADFQLAENDGTPLVPPAPRPTAEIDVSALTVAENDGSILFEPTREEPAKIDAPDFGLDEPGAVLETLKEEKVLLNPDVSGLSIAAAGVDLIDASDRPKAPPPRAPDVSSIQLADA